MEFELQSDDQEWNSNYSYKPMLGISIFLQATSSTHSLLTTERDREFIIENSFFLPMACRTKPGRRNTQS